MIYNNIYEEDDASYSPIEDTQELADDKQLDDLNVNDDNLQDEAPDKAST